MNAPVKTPDAPDIDADAIRTWCGSVFGYLDGLVPLRILPETGTPAQKPHLEFPSVGTIADRIIALAPRAAERQRAVYVVPGTVQTAGSARASDIVQTGVVLIDLDGGDIPTVRNHLVASLGAPTLEIASGGVTPEGHAKLHLYWRLTEAAEGPDLDRVAALRGTIAAKVGGDTSFASLHQPIRVAGTIHGKNGTRAPVRLLAATAREYDLDELEEAGRAMPALVGTKTTSFDIGTGPRGPSAEDLATQTIRDGNQDDISRFAAMSRVIGHWIRNARAGRCSIDAAREAVLAHNTAMIDPPWAETRVRREFAALLRKDIVARGPMPAPAEDAVDEAPDQSDDALAAAFADTWSDEVRHVPAWGAWFVWTGQVWERDETRLARERMRQNCRAAAGATEKPHEARRIASDRTIAAALRIAASDPKLATRTSNWDAHPMLLNTPSGVLDLATGEVLSHDPGLHLTQMTAASPGTGCPLWRAFLATVTDGDFELQAYLRRLSGYCLTGDTRAQVFAFLHGTGGNGKSVFLNTIATILGSYAATATLDTFMSSRSERHLTELAGLRAARLVMVPETEAGRSWSEARIKTVTGGEVVRANFMRCDHFEFRPQFKLVVMGNHRPGLSSVGEAMRRRLHLVPFTVTIPPDARDASLPERLLAERDGILGWMIEGCAEWQTSGLNPPASVLAAAEDYFASEDIVGQWIAETCVVDPSAAAGSTELFVSWKGWAEDNGHPPGSAKALGEALRARGLAPGKVGRQRGWHGIGLCRATGASGGPQ